MLRKLISTTLLGSVFGMAHAAPELGPIQIVEESDGYFAGTLSIEGITDPLQLEQIKVRLGSMTDYYRHNVVYSDAASGIRFMLQKDENGQPIIRVRATQRMSQEAFSAVIKLYVGGQKIYGVYHFNFSEPHSIVYNQLGKSAAHYLAEPEKSPILSIQPHNMMQHEVMPGETASLIAIKYAKELPQFAHWRDLMHEIHATNAEAFIDGDINRIIAGKVIHLPAQEMASPPAPEPIVDQPVTVEQTVPTQFYTVQQGQSLSLIAMELSAGENWRGMMKQLISLNPSGFIGNDINKIAVGEQLTVPDVAEYEPIGMLPGRHYQVTEGDSISAIALYLTNKYFDAYPWGAVMQHVIRLNPHAFIRKNPELLRADVKILIPTLSDLEAKPAMSVVEPVKDVTPPPIQRQPAKNYTVVAGDSVSVIAFKLLPEYPQYEGWYDLMSTILSLNEEVFTEYIGGDLPEGLELKLPEKIQIAPEVTRVEPERVEVPEGYSISMFAMKLAKEQPELGSWVRIMDQLHQLNPDAFVDGDINQLKANAVLVLPQP